MFQGKNIWMIPLLTALVVAAIGWWSDGQLRGVIQSDLEASLQSGVDANATSLEIWMENQKRIATSLAEEPRFKTLAVEMLEQARDLSGQRVIVEDRTRQLLAGADYSGRLQTLGYALAQVVDTNLVVIAENARGRGRLGMSVRDDLKLQYQELFNSGEARIITPFKVSRMEVLRRVLEREGVTLHLRFGRDRPGNLLGITRDGQRLLSAPEEPAIMQVAVPLKNKAGIVVGALALIIDPNAEFTRILSVARHGETGETFAFDAKGLLLSESRFDEELKRLGLIDNKPDAVSALNLHLRDPGGDLTQGHVVPTNGPLILMVERAVTGGSGVELTPFRDYRGVPVVGAWRWMGNYGFGVGLKLDAREAFHTLRMVRSVFYVLFLLLLLASLTILLITYTQARVQRRLTEVELKARQLGQYRLTEKIGEGGMGSVYKAHHTLLRRETALKLLPPDKADPQAIQRFEQEVQLTCTLTHPNTIQVFDYGHTPDGIFYYAMEYLDGLNLADLVARYGAQPEERVIHILRQVCDSLNEAHGLGLIHRDIKPANVFVSDRGGVPDIVKVLDFGLVKQFGPNASQTDAEECISADGIVGTPNFIAPETIKNHDQADARSDLYSVGVLGYFLLTGQYVFEGASIAEVCRHHINDDPPAPGARTGRKYDAQLEAIIMRCLAKSPAARPQSADELAGHSPNPPLPGSGILNAVPPGGPPTGSRQPNLRFPCRLAPHRKCRRR